MSHQLTQHVIGVMSAYHIELVIEDARTFVQLSRAPYNAVHQQGIRHDDHLHDRCALDTCAAPLFAPVSIFVQRLPCTLPCSTIRALRSLARQARL